MWKNKESFLYKLFELVLSYKFIFALLQICGGIALLFTSHNLIAQYAINITHGELIEDPRDSIAQHLLFFFQNFSIGTQIFFGLYLIVNGLVHATLIYGLWKKKLHFYPVAAILLSIILIYQLYRYTITNSSWLIFISITDFIYIWLILHEYRILKKELY
jgi:uncharacterized membrane protein